MAQKNICGIYEGEYKTKYILNLNCDSTFSLIKETSPASLTTAGKWTFYNDTLVLLKTDVRNQKQDQRTKSDTSGTLVIPVRKQSWELELTTTKYYFKGNQIHFLDLAGHKILLKKKRK